MNYRLIGAIAVSLFFNSCEINPGYDLVSVQSIENPIIVDAEYLAGIEYQYFDINVLLNPGLIDSSIDNIVIGFWGDSTPGGISCFSWDGIQNWSIDYGSYSHGYPAGVCISDDSVYFSVLDEIPVLNAITGEYLSSISVEGMSDSIMLPEAPGEYMPMCKSTHIMDIKSKTILWTFHEFVQRSSYCGLVTDIDVSFQRYLRIYKNESQWYIGMTVGHFDRLSLFKVPSINYALRPNITNIALTDSSIIAALSYRDLVMEFDHYGQHIRSTHFGHQLQGPSEFTCTFLVSSSARCLLSDLDTDDNGFIYLLYSGYATNQNGKAEIWRVNTVTGEAHMTQLNHSASAFTVCGDRVAVVEQTHEPGEGDEVILLGTPTIHLYQIDWDA